MTLRRWLGWALLPWIIGAGCGRKAAIFITPYDKELKRALRRQGHGWVSAGAKPDTSSKHSSAYLLPGQFIRVVMELPRPLSEEANDWQLVRIDTLRVYEDSLVYVPWAGSVRLGGLSLDSARVVLQRLVDRTFIGARLRLYPMYAYYLFGQVSQQGRILMDRAQIPLTELLAWVPVQTRETDFSRVKVLRGPPDYKQVFLVDVRSADVLTGSFLLQSEDIIVIEPRGIIRGRIELQNFFAILSILQFINFILILRGFFV